MKNDIVQKLESVYDHPTLYDVLFSDSCKKEIDFLLNLYKTIFGRKSGDFFEPACGTGRLLWRLRKAGHNAVGLDLNPKAISFCNRRLHRHGFADSALFGDMSDFSLVSLGRSSRSPFDLAFNFVSSFLHLTTETAARSHLNSVADCLKPKGLYVLGLHLLPQGEAFCSSESWKTRHGSLSLDSLLRRKHWDRRRRIETVEFRIRATTPTRIYEIVDIFPLRTYSVSQFRSLLKAVDRFDICETYDFTLNFNCPIKIDSRSEDVVFVLQKKD